MATCSLPPRGSRKHSRKKKKKNTREKNQWTNTLWHTLKYTQGSLRPGLLGRQPPLLCYGVYAQDLALKVHFTLALSEESLPGVVITCFPLATLCNKVYPQDLATMAHFHHPQRISQFNQRKRRRRRIPNASRAVWRGINNQWALVEG